MLKNKKRHCLHSGAHQLNDSKFYLFTINACITPGNQPMMVNTTLIRKVVPKPCFKKTANGGKNIFNNIVRIDIIYCFKFLQSYSRQSFIINAIR